MRNRKKGKINKVQKEIQLRAQPFHKKLFIFCAALISFLLFCTLIYFSNLVSIYSFNLPSMDTPFKRVLPESTVLYDSKGEILYTIFDKENRMYIPLNKIPTKMKMAMIAAEDIDFYHEDGINIPAIARSLFHNIFLNPEETGLQGASTITQQLVKYTTLDSSRTIERKIREVIITCQITQHYSKNQILEAYLNDVAFGGNNYGVEAASQAYFGKSIDKLDLSQYAFLAGLPQAPGVYSPLFSENKNAMQYAMDRRTYVLNNMLKYKDITKVTKAEVDEAKKEKLVFTPRPTLRYPHFVFYVQNILNQTYGADNVKTQGMRVYTSIDPTIQDIAQNVVTNDVANNLRMGFNTHNGALVAIDSTNGNVLAMVGSKDYNDSSVQVAGNNNMATTPITPGSSVKPFVYLTAFQNGMSADTVVHDKKSVLPKNYQPNDWDNKEEGDMPISRALLESRNIPAVETCLKAGLSNVYDNLIRAGYLITPEHKEYPSMCIGGFEVPLITHTAAYQVFSQNGVMHTTRPILAISDKYGSDIINNQVKTVQVYDRKYTDQINAILKNYPTLGYIKSQGYTVAGKTGTSDQNLSNLFTGYSDHLAVGVWVGNTDNSATSSMTFGENAAAPLWNDFMNQVLPMFPKTANF